VALHQVNNLRGYVLRKLRELKIYVSCLSPTETDALLALSNPQTVSEITEHVLARLGHTIEAGSPVLRANHARQKAAKAKRRQITRARRQAGKSVRATASEPEVQLLPAATHEGSLTDSVPSEAHTTPT
jgi:hypothetical protein